MLEAVLESMGLLVMISWSRQDYIRAQNSENAGKVTVLDKFPCAVFRNVVDSNSIFCQFCMC